MFALVLAMLVILALGVAVVGLVALPARREGRDVLSSRGEDVVDRFERGAVQVKERVQRTDAR